MQASAWSSSPQAKLCCVLAALGIFLGGCTAASKTESGPPPALEILTQSPLTAAQVGVPYSAMLMARGGATPYRWSLVNGIIPKGLMFSAATGVISGTPSQAISSTSLTFSVTDSSSSPKTRSVILSLTISNATLISIVVTPASPSVGVGKTQQFTATGTYSDNSTQNLTGSVAWASSSTATAAVSAGGLASALKAGTSTISATSGSVSGSTTLTVTAAALVSIVVTPASPSVGVGKTQQFTATGTYSDNSIQNLTGSVAWASSSTATAAVSAGGLASALKAGTSTISATSGSVSGSTTLTVTAAALVSIVVTPASPSGGVGKTQQFTATGTYSDNSTQNLTSSVAWASSITATATISVSGLATAVTAGTTTISGTFGSIAGSTSLNVPGSSSISVSVSPKRGGLTVGQTLNLTATVLNDPLSQGVNWSATGGTFSAAATASGAATTYTAPATPGVYSLTATSASDGTQSASATIGVTDLAGVFTYHNDLSRDGSNTSEYALSTSNVISGTFGKLFSCTVDGAIYAQPLWVANLTISGVKRNVVFVATQHESLYAFDADVNTTPCTPLWHANLIDAAHGGSSSESSVPSGAGGLVGDGNGDIMPEVGITGTPVIDPAAKTLYVVAKSVNASGTTFFQRLHAIDITTGSERSGSPVLIQATYPGTGDGGTTVTFVARQQNQRPGLALVNGIIYIGWGSHEDAAPFYGWIMAYNASTLSQTGALNITPNAGYGGVWMGGAAFAADSNNNIYALTGNGTFDVTNATGPTNDYGDSFLKLTSGLSVLQYFTP